MKKYSSNSVFFALFTVSFFVIFFFTLPIMASLYIVGDLGGSNNIGNYGVFFYGIGNALGIPLGRLISYKLGTVKALSDCLFVFAISALLCALSPNYPIFIFARLIQGIIAGPFYVICNQILTSLEPQEKKQLFTSISLMLVSCVPILGACWGGWIAYDFNWRIAFLLNIPFLIYLGYFFRVRLRGFQPALSSYVFDGVGYLFFFIGVLCLSVVILTGQEFDWFRSSMITTQFIIGSIALCFFLFRSRHLSFPLLDLSLLKNTIFTFGIIYLIFFFAIYFSTIILLALWLGISVNYTPYWIGLLLLVIFFAGLVPSLLFSNQLRKFDPRFPLAMSLFCLMISSFHTTIFSEYVDFNRIASSRIFTGLGLFFFLPPIFRLCFHSFAEVNGLAVLELFQIVRTLSTSLGAALFSTLWEHRQAFYHSRMGGDLNVFSIIPLLYKTIKGICFLNKN